MNGGQVLSLVVLAGMGGLLRVVQSRGGQQVVFRITAAHAVGFPLLVVARSVAGEVSARELLLLAVTQALSIVCVLLLARAMKVTACGPK